MVGEKNSRTSHNTSRLRTSVNCYQPSLKMSDYLKRAFRAQLTTTMDSLLRSAVFEIMTVFENSIHDHQMELAHKGEEVVQLKIKLQTAELKLRERECGGDRGFENNKTVTSETQKQPEPVQNTPEQTSDVPEIDVEGIVFK